MTTMTKNETVRGTKQSMAGTMKAAVIQRFGGPDVLELIEVPVAEPRPGSSANQGERRRPESVRSLHPTGRDRP